MTQFAKLYFFSKVPKSLKKEKRFQPYLTFDKLLFGWLKLKWKRQRILILDVNVVIIFACHINGPATWFFSWSKEKLIVTIFILLLYASVYTSKHAWRKDGCVLYPLKQEILNNIIHFLSDNSEFNQFPGRSTASLCTKQSGGRRGQ